MRMKQLRSTILQVMMSKLKLLIGSWAAPACYNYKPNLGRAASKPVRRRKQHERVDSSYSCGGPKAKRVKAALKNPIPACAGRSGACMMTESFRVVQLHLAQAQDDDHLNDVMCLSSRREYSVIDYDGAAAAFFHTAPPSPSTITTYTRAVLRSSSDAEFCPDGSSLFSVAEVMATDSSNPRCDFVVSMREMMQALRPTRVQQLEALLECYLRLNAPAHHATIALAFLSALATSPAAAFPHDLATTKLSVY